MERSLFKKRPDVYHELEVALKKFKPDLISLLKNPPKNTDHRDQIKRAPTTGLQLAGHTEKQKLPEQFVQETLILSDILQLNEFVCIDLLLAGEQQQPNFPGLTRGLVAVLLYHDGRRCLVSALKTLIQSREGITWTLGLYEDLSRLVTKFTDELLEEGLITTILQQLDELDVQKELDKLERGQGIGDVRHKQQLIDFITDQRQLLAECLYCFACQSPFPKRESLQLLSSLKKRPSTDADGTLDSVTLTLLMAMLYCLNVDPLDEAAELQTSVREDLFPLLSDHSFIPEFHQEITQQDPWQSRGMCACVQFAWALVLRSCSQWPNVVGAVEVLEEDEGVLDLAVDESVFGFLRYCVVGSSSFHQEEYFVQRLHSLVTGFIVKMPLKVKELRNHGDEASRIIQAHLQDGVEPPAGLPRHFEDFMKMIGGLYDKDPCGLELAADFWCPMDTGSFTSFSPYDTGMSPALRQRASQKQVSLNKFLRLAGDLLLPPLFVPYLDMLTGLANSPEAAHHCFNLLKSAANGPLSWDHFFGSFKQYYMDLRQDGGHSVMMYGSLTREIGRDHRPDLSNYNITAEELEGLEAVLRLTERVADKDEKARLAMCESQAWLPIASLFGLLGCPVPLRLKAQILSTLAAFAKSPEIASSMWHTLELSQILQTVTPSGQAVQQGGIQVELNELESRSETYPETRAFIKLLDHLTDIPLPSALGSGYRVPGFEPYLRFLRDDVFLKFSSRGYQNPDEKWTVAKDVLQVLFKLLEGYIPKPEDFVDQFVELQGGERAVVPKPPGCSLMIHLLKDTPTFRMLLNVIDGASSALEHLSITSDGSGELEKAALLCLRMVETALEKQEQFVNTFRSIMQQSSVMVSRLEDLLLSINPQSSAPDYLMKIMRYVCHLHTGAELSLSVVKILCLVCQSTSVQQHLISLLIANQSLSQQILIGFVDHLEINEPEDIHENDEQELGKEFVDEKSFNTSQIRNAVRQNILRLILHSLQHSSPSLAHFLLGYDLRKSVAKTNLQDPGVLGASKTCLHAVLDLLNKGVDTPQGPSCVTETPKFAELAYQLIYSLCANKDTATPTLRYLRTSHNFLYRHLQHLPFKNLARVDEDDGQTSLPLQTITSQQSWLLKTAAIELRMTAQGRQRSHAQRLLGLLMGEPSAQRAVLAGMTQIPELVPRRLEEDFTAADTSQAIFPDMGQSHTRRKLLAILESLEFTQDVPPPLQLNYFDASVTEKAIASCEQKAEDISVMFCNVPVLHKLLMGEITGVQGNATAGQRNFLLQEVRDILQNVVLRNMMRESLHIKKEAFEAWRRVIEVALASCPVEILPRDTRQTVIAEVLQDMLCRISDEKARSELTSPVSGVILSLMAHLRQCTISLNSDITPMPLSDSSVGSRSLQQAGASLPVGASVAILKGLIETVLRSGGALQRVRANLYAALLYFMQTAPETQQTKERGVMENVLSLYPGQSWDTSILPVLSSYGEPFMDAVCRDSCDGHDVGRMLAFSLLDAIIAVDWQQRWLNYLSLKGYLRHMIEALPHEDHILQSMLDPSPEPLKALYNYESKMALFTRIAQSFEGAKVLLQAGLLSRLAECAFLDQRPEQERAALSSGLYGYDQDMSDVLQDSFVPSVMERYRQLLMPSLKVVQAILTSLGSQHKEASVKVLHFVVSHVDVFLSVLQDRQTVHTSGSLQELGLATGIICNMRLTEANLMVDEELGQEQVQLRGPLARIQRLMIGLLPRYSTSENWEKIIKSVMEQHNEEPGAKYSLIAMETTEKLQRICSNIVGFCKTVMNATGSVASHRHVLFAPSLTESLSRDSRSNREVARPVAALSAYRPISLGLPVSFVKKCSDQILQTAELCSQTQLKLQNLTELSSDELRELSQAEFNRGAVQERLSTQQRHQLAQKCLTQIVRFKENEISSLLYIIENYLFIIWHHLDFYFLHCIPSDEERRMRGGLTLTDSRMRRLQDWTLPPGDSISSNPAFETQHLGDGVTREEIETLKRESTSTLTEPFFKKLVEIEQAHGKGRSRLSFLQVIVRRIKGLLTIHGTSARNEAITSGLR